MTDGYSMYVVTKEGEWRVVGVFDAEHKAQEAVEQFTKGDYLLTDYYIQEIGLNDILFRD